MGLAERLRVAVWEVVSGQRPVFSAEHGYCLQMVRQVVSPALGFDPGDAWGFHNVYSRQRVEGNDKTAWARSTQRTMRDRYALEVPLDSLQIGDLVFNSRLGRPQGHVGIVVSVTGTEVVLLENTGTERGTKHDGYNRLTNLSMMPYPAALQAMRFKEVQGEGSQWVI